MDDERAARYSDLFGVKHDHADNCAYCPICAAIGVVRNTRPEVLDHLAKAAKEILAAAAIMLEEASEVVGTPREEQGQKAPEQSPKVRHIDVV